MHFSRQVTPSPADTPKHQHCTCTMYATPLSMHFTAPLPLQSGVRLGDPGKK
ncbi:MAG: hypothetical protein IPH35_07710 [Rhodoferax sp.]|nr:hypothetical protein [Rhodoferax sp.]